MIMRTQAQLNAASKAVESWLDRLDVDALASGNEEHAKAMREIGEANKAISEDERRLLEAVVRGRQAGLTQAQIAVMLGVSRQAVRQRFGDVLART